MTLGLCHSGEVSPCPQVPLLRMPETGILMSPGTQNSRKRVLVGWVMMPGAGVMGCIMVHPRTAGSKRGTGAQKRVVFIAGSRAGDLIYTRVLGWALAAPSSHPVLTQLPGSPAMDATERNQSKRLAKKQNGHEMSTYGGFWVRLELFYLLGKKKLEKQKVKVVMVG